MKILILSLVGALFAALATVAAAADPPINYGTAIAESIVHLEEDANDHGTFAGDIMTCSAETDVLDARSTIGASSAPEANAAKINELDANRTAAWEVGAPDIG